MKKLSLLLVVLMLASTVLVSCSGDSTTNSIIGEWEATQSIEGVELKIGMTFNEDGTMTTSSMGISVDGTYSISGDKITVKMTVAGIESTEVNTFRVEGDKLTIVSEEGVELVLTRKAAPATVPNDGGADSAIVGVWEVTQTMEGVGDITMTMTFNADGTMSSGAYGVSVSGTYTISGDKLTTQSNIDGIDTTEVVTFRVEGNQLTIIEDDGTTTVLTKK